MAMKIFLIGGTGRTGLTVAKGALEAGHSVTAAVRRAPQTAGVLATSGGVKGSGSSSEVSTGAEGEAYLDVAGPHDNLNIVVGNLLDKEFLAKCMAGHDAVVVTLGTFSKPGETVTLYSSMANAYVPAMEAAGIKRLLTVFGAGFAKPEVPSVFPDMPPPYDIIPPIQRDMRIVWDVITRADLDYTVFCPADFPSGPRSSEYITAVNKVPGAFWVTTGMVADAILKDLTANQWVKSRVGISATCERNM